MFHCQLWWGPQVFPVICQKLISTRHTVTVVWSNRYLKIQNQICLAFFRNLYDYFVAVMIHFFCFKAYPSHSHITVKIKRLETFLVVLIDLIWPWFRTTVSKYVQSGFYLSSIGLYKTSKSYLSSSIFYWIFNSHILNLRFGYFDSYFGYLHIFPSTKCVLFFLVHFL